MIAYKHITKIIGALMAAAVAACFLAMAFPGLYLAMTNFHTQIVPTDLLLSLAAARQGVPFPAAVEIVLMEVAFELLREAGAAKIHVRIAAPVICTECTKGAESSRKEELAGARWTEEELKEKIRADSVRFLTREEFSRALGIRACRACFGCGEETRKDEENGRTV